LNWEYNKREAKPPFFVATYMPKTTLHSKVKKFLNENPGKTYRQGLIEMSRRSASKRQAHNNVGRKDEHERFLKMQAAFPDY